jgi:hypothetical protein
MEPVLHLSMPHFFFLADVAELWYTRPVHTSTGQYGRKKRLSLPTDRLVGAASARLPLACMHHAFVRKKTSQRFRSGSSSRTKGSARHSGATYGLQMNKPRGSLSLEKRRQRYDAVHPQPQRPRVSALTFILPSKQLTSIPCSPRSKPHSLLPGGVVSPARCRPGRTRGRLPAG